MQYFLSQMKLLLPDLNERTITETELQEVCDRLGAVVVELPLDNNGYYVRRGQDQFIFLKKSLGILRKFEALSHETAHLGFHSECDFLEFRHEQEAFVFSLIAVLIVLAFSFIISNLVYNIIFSKD
jgi:hypothetical protein